MEADETPEIVVIGASAGGVEALQSVVSAFPADLDAAVFVVLHLWPFAASHLPEILSRAGNLPAVHATDGTPFETGRIYVAPPDRHIFFQDGILRVIRGPKENRHRPSIDVLFRSAAMTYGDRVIGVLLTGGDDDGAAGLKMIQERGGAAVVQDPADSAHPEMPRYALEVLEPDFEKPLAEVGPTVAKLVRGVIKPREKPMAEPVDRPFGSEAGQPIDVKELGTPTAFSCPDCNGTLWELRDGELLRYRCRVGHAYSAESMIEAESDAVERALWEAVRVLEESASVSRRIARTTGVFGEDMARRAEQREQHARVIRDLLLSSAA